MRALALVALSGCSSLLGIDELQGPSATPDGPDEPGPNQDAEPTPGTIRISGEVLLVTQNGALTPAPSATVTLESPNAVAEPAVTDANGKYDLVIFTGGVAVDGTLDVMVDGERQVIQYFASPLNADRSVTSQVFTASFLNTIGPLCGGFDPQLATVLAVLSDAQGASLPDNPIESTPMTTWCGLLEGAFVTGKTGDDGIAFAVGIPTGPIEIRSGLAARLYDVPGGVNVIAALRVP